MEACSLPTLERSPRRWIKRIIDHDGTEESGGGGLEMWFALARAVGLDDDDVRSERLVQPGTRFAVDAYVDFARRKPWLESVASSLTELFGPPVMAARVAAIVAQYPWIDRGGLRYFESRIPLAQEDAAQALGWVQQEAVDRDAQDRCVAALQFKCDVLWSIFDATALSCGVFG